MQTMLAWMWKMLGWRGALVVCLALWAIVLGVTVRITQTRLDTVRAELQAAEARHAQEAAGLRLQLATGRAEIADLVARARALADQVRETEDACARERTLRRRAAVAVAKTQPVPLMRAEVDHAVVDMPTSGRVADVLNAVFVRGAGSGGDQAAPASGLPGPGPAGDAGARSGGAHRQRDESADPDGQPDLHGRVHPPTGGGPALQGREEAR